MMYEGTLYLEIEKGWVDVLADKVSKCLILRRRVRMNNIN